MAKGLPRRKYNWPDEAEIFKDLDDEVLLKFWRYAPSAKNEHESHCSNILCDELVDRNLI